MHRRTKVTIVSALSVATGAALLIGAGFTLTANHAGQAAAPATTPAQSPGGSPAPSDSGSPSPAASATRSPGPSRSAVASRPPTNSRPPLPANVKPDATNTGVMPGVALTAVNSDQTFSSSANGQVISGKIFNGFVRVTGANITFRNCIFHGRATTSNNPLLDTEQSTGTITVEDSEFVPTYPSPTIDGLSTRNTNIYRANIHGGVDGMKADSNTLVQDSYIHDMHWFASDPNQGGGSTHNDGVQSFAFEKNVTLRHNNIDMSTTNDANAALQTSASNTHVENNWLDGGGCTLNFAAQVLHGATLTGIYITNNRFGRHRGFAGCAILISLKTVLAQNSGNVWADTGQPIPPPQQHD